MLEPKEEIKLVRKCLIFARFASKPRKTKQNYTTNFKQLMFRTEETVPFINIVQPLNYKNIHRLFLLSNKEPWYSFGSHFESKEEKTDPIILM